MSALGRDHRTPQTRANAADDELTARAAGETIEKSLCVARELLSMDIAWIAEFRDGKRVFRIVDGDAPSFDTISEPEVCDRDVTASAGIGSYVGVPIELVDGTVYGTLCVAGHRPSDELAERDAHFLRGVARRVAADLEDLRFSVVDG